MKALNRVEELINRIAASKPGLTVENVRKMVEDKKRRYHGLLTDEGAVHLVAQDLEVNLTYQGRRWIKLNTLVPGLRDVSVEASIVHIGKPREFPRRGGAVGRVLRLTLNDGAGQATCVLWDERVNDFLSMQPKVGWRVQVLHGYTRAGADGIELHVGSRGSLRILEAYDGVAASVRKISELREYDRVFLLDVVVMFKSQLKRFRSRAGEGKVLRVRVKDDSGSLTLVLWNEVAEKMAHMEDGSMIRILGGSVRRGISGELEIHVDSLDQVKLIPGKVDLTELLFRISDLKPGMRGLILLLRVYSKPSVRVFKMAEGKGRVSSLLVGDETGLTRLVLWNDAVSYVENIKIGDVLLVRNAYTRDGLNGLEVHLSSRGVVEVNPNLPAPRSLNLNRNIGELRDGDVYITIQGVILTSPEIRTVSTLVGEVKVSSFTLGDDTGSIRVSLWRDLADEVENLKPGAVVKLTHLYVKPGLAGELEASSTRFSEIEILKEPGD